MTRLTHEQIGVLLRPIKAARVQTRDGMSYVEAYDIRAMMNRVFGFAGWSLVEVTPAVCVYERDTELKNGKAGVTVAYRAHLALIVHTPEGDATYAGSAVADATMPDYKRADAHDMALKSAESGALKRAATNLGDQFGLSLYRDSSLRPVVGKIVGFEPDTEPPGSAASIPREPEEVSVPLADQSPAEASAASAGDTITSGELRQRLTEMTGPQRTLFIRHLAMEHQINDYNDPTREDEILALLDKFQGVTT